MFAAKPDRTRQFGLSVLVLATFLITGTVQAGSIREVKENVERVQSIELPCQFAVIGDNEDGERIYLRLMSSLIGRNPGSSSIWEYGESLIKKSGTLLDLETVNGPSSPS
jgi:hypothetical protein